MEPTRPSYRAIMSPRRAAHLARYADHEVLPVRIRIANEMLRILSLLWFSGSFCWGQSAVAHRSAVFRGQNAGESQPVGVSSWIVTRIAAKPGGSPAHGVDVYVIAIENVHVTEERWLEWALFHVAATCDSSRNDTLERSCR